MLVIPYTILYRWYLIYNVLILEVLNLPANRGKGQS